MFKLSSEILSIIDLLSEEKNISKNVVIDAIEEAFKKLALSYYGDGNGEIVAKMNLNNGDITLFQKKIVKPKAVATYEISINDAKLIDKNIDIDNDILVEVPPIDFNRTSLNKVKNIILEKIKVAEKELEYDEFKKREGEIVIGTVKKTSPTSIIVSLGNKTEAILYRDGIMRTDNFRSGDKIKAYLKEVRRNDFDCQIVLSRTDNNFLAMLIAENVVEVQDGIIEIKAISRACGVKSKVAVITNDPNIDAVGSCIGARGCRIKPVIEELHGERIDIVYYDRDIVNFAKNAISPAKASYGEFSEETNSVELIIPDDQLKLAIGKSGQNVRLASQLIGCNISVIAESEKKKKTQEIFLENVSFMAKALDLEESVAQFLVSSNIPTPLDLINVGVDTLIKSGVFTDEIAQELVNRAIAFNQEEEAKNKKLIKELNIDESVLTLDGMNYDIAILLGKNGVKTIQDIADLSTDEFIEYCGEKYYKNANKAIMSARKIAYNLK